MVQLFKATYTGRLRALSQLRDTLNGNECGGYDMVPAARRE